MKRLLLGVVFALGLAAPAAAQEPSTIWNWIRGACMLCGVDGSVDYAGPVSGGVLVAGWGLECVSGQPVDRVDIWYQGDDGFFHGVPASAQWLGAVGRPDAVNYMAWKGCPQGAHLYNGFHVFIATQHVPAGKRRVMVNLWRGPYFQGHLRTVVFP